MVLFHRDLNFDYVLFKNSCNFREFHNFIIQVGVGIVQQDAIASEQDIGQSDNTDENQSSHPLDLSQVFNDLSMNETVNIEIHYFRATETLHPHFDFANVSVFL